MNRQVLPRRRLAALAVILALALASLGGAAASSTQFPVSVAAANGTVTFERAPTRIVSLSPSATQDLYAVGAGSQVVAVDSYSTYPPQAPRTSLSAYSPNAEAIAKYRPDLVIVADDLDHIDAQLHTLGIPVLLEPAVANLAGVYAEISQIARATGHAAQGAQVVTGMKAQIAAIVRSVGKPKRPLTVYDELDQTYYSATSHTFIGQMYTLLGLHDIADKAPGSDQYPQLTAEYVIAADPDLIVLADTVCCGQDAKTVAGRPGWDAITAVEDGGVVPVNDSIASQWGPRIVLFLKTVARAVVRLERRLG